ncbi:TPA: hypothetical protein QB288_002245 [Pasteurella multocida]|nr:hypothetical protein [Pasteurella multocida]HDR1105436.1 hypothetical protein [Pasteurella multocida]
MNNNFGPENFEGFAYLDFDNFTVAWNIARGMFCTTSQLPNDEYKNSFLSTHMAGLLSNNSADRLYAELAIEKIRLLYFPNCVSRLKGAFIFDEIDSISRFWACNNWGPHFKDEYLADIGVASTHSTKVDANWINYIMDESCKLKGDFGESVKNYWRGIPYPDKEPIWERIIEGYITIWSNDIRKKAIENILSIHPNSWIFLRYASLCAKAGLTEGQIFPFITQHNSTVKIDYFMQAKYIQDAQFIDSLLAYDTGNSITIENVGSEYEFIQIPDLSGFSKELTVNDKNGFSDLVKLLINGQSI